MTPPDSSLRMSPACIVSLQVLQRRRIPRSVVDEDDWSVPRAIFERLLDEEDSFELRPSTSCLESQNLVSLKVYCRPIRTPCLPVIFNLVSSTAITCLWNLSWFWQARANLAVPLPDGFVRECVLHRSGNASVGQTQVVEQGIARILSSGSILFFVNACLALATMISKGEIRFMVAVDQQDAWP